MTADGVYRDERQAAVAPLNGHAERRIQNLKKLLILQGEMAAWLKAHA